MMLRGEGLEEKVVVEDDEEKEEEEDMKSRGEISYFSIAVIKHRDQGNP
jgi:hypothetical protein